MGKHTYILYRLARFLAGVPPDTLGAMVLFALEHPEVVPAICAGVLFLLKLVVVVVVPVLKYCVGLLCSAAITWYLVRMIAIHLWPRLPTALRQVLRRMVERAQMRPRGQDRGGSRESAFSRNSKRHPHW